VIWEPSRFGFAYALVRAYWRSGDERYAELFWQLVEDWRANNTPQLGPNWKCGQEMGGGRIIGEACHFVDLLRFLAGRPIISHSRFTVTTEEI